MYRWTRGESVGTNESEMRISVLLIPLPARPSHYVPFTLERIARGSFQLNDRTYQVPVNNGPNALHGGLCGFDKRVWTVLSMSKDDSETPSVTFEYVSVDGEEGYPGTLRVHVTYSIVDGRELRLSYSAKLLAGNAKNDGKDDDKPVSTILSLTNHTYFNLSGGAEQTVHAHNVTIPSRHYLEVDADTLPTGRVLHVAADDDAAMDLSKGALLGDNLARMPPTGFDHFYLTRPLQGAGDGKEILTYVHDATMSTCGRGPLVNAATVTSTASGLRMTMATNEPGFQLYTGYYTDAKVAAKSTQAAGFKYDRFSGLCLEASRFPDAVSHELWRPMVVLRSGEEYRQETGYRFAYE